MADRLHDMRCLIIGGTTGIGLATAIRFSQEGARLVVTGLDVAPSSADFAHQTCDATSESQVEALFTKTLQHLGGLDVLYHVAGTSGRKYGDGPLHECT